MNTTRIALFAAVVGSTSVLAVLQLAAARAPESSPAYTPDEVVIDKELVARELVTKLRRDKSLLPEWDQRPHLAMFNREAPVPPQCYTRHEGVFNPCYVCHQARRPDFENLQDDIDLQSAYLFSDVGFKNHWSNLFEDRSARIAGISDDDIINWIRQDNYSELAPRLQEAEFAGWIPDLQNLELGRAAFDEQGFAKDGSHWVTFNYKPFPSTFWPTNGATDDVMIRLPEKFRTDATGAYSRDVYAANLALLEAGIKHMDRIGCLPVDENIVGVDLDGDGELSTAHSVVRRKQFVGAASDTDVFQTMYPQGTEFLHTVRYIDMEEDGTIIPSKRMKEVRYMRRHLEMRRRAAAFLYIDEMRDKTEMGKLPRHNFYLDERTLESETGWQISGFIEGVDGRLRANTFEETMFCMGCHNSVGSTIDKTFSFGRKVDGAEGWGYINLKGMVDAPSMGETRGEIVTYLERVGGGSEFRNNDEMQRKWFNEDGTLNFEAIAKAKDVHDLIAPSRERALALNKAYRLIVEDQDYIFGRDPVLAPPTNVYDEIDPDEAPTLPLEKQFTYDIRLDWNALGKNAVQAKTDADPES